VNILPLYKLSRWMLDGLIKAFFCCGLPVQTRDIPRGRLVLGFDSGLNTPIYSLSTRTGFRSLSDKLIIEPVS